ncbi:MAG TPA: type II CAAX endopeptidase family protein [Terriglobales bacterium]
MSQPSSDVLVFAAVLLIGYPIADYVVTSRLKRSAQSNKRFYAWVLGSEWLLTIAAVGLLKRHGSTLSDIGEASGRRIITIGFVGARLIFGAIFAAYNRKRILKLPPERLSKVLRQAGPLVPQPGVERAMWVLVAVTAGFCEELLYRGWLWRFFSDLTGHLWIAVVLSAVAFGLAHAYQGRAGIVSTGIVGLLFSVPVLLTNSLVPVQVIHAGIDLTNGLLLSKAAESISGVGAHQSSC